MAALLIPIVVGCTGGGASPAAQATANVIAPACHLNATAVSYVGESLGYGGLDRFTWRTNDGRTIAVVHVLKLRGYTPWSISCGSASWKPLNGFSPTTFRTAYSAA